MLLKKANEQAYHQSEIIRDLKIGIHLQILSQKKLFMYFFFTPLVDHLFFLFMRSNQY